MMSDITNQPSAIEDQIEARSNLTSHRVVLTFQEPYEPRNGRSHCSLYLLLSMLVISISVVAMISPFS